MNDGLKIEDIKSSLELNTGSARVHFIVLKNGKMGFFAESKKTKQSVSIAFRENEIYLIKQFFKQL